VVLPFSTNRKQKGIIVAKVIRTVGGFFQSWGRALAATQCARQGDFEQAKRLMLKD
jgi:hypothetical protein